MVDRAEVLERTPEQRKKQRKRCTQVLTSISMHRQTHGNALTHTHIQIADR